MSTGTSNHSMTDEKKIRVLVLDDMPTDAELAIRELKRAGIDHSAQIVESRDLFIQQLEEFKPDIVLSDYAMPNFDGMQALEFVREHYPLIPVIILTGATNEETAVECMKRGAVDYVIKEHPARLGPAVTGALAGKRLREEKEKADDAIRRANQEWEITFNTINDAVCLLTRDSKIIRSNQAMKDLLGVSLAEDINGQNCCQLLHGNSGIIEDCPYQRAIKSKQKESKVLLVDDRFLDVIVFPIFDDNYNVSGAVHIVRDITDKRTTEKSLKDSVDNLHEAVRAGGIGLWEWDLKTNKVIFSKEWKEQIGYKDHEIGDEHTEWKKRIHPDDLHSVLASVDKSIKERNQDHRKEFRFLHKNGSYRSILAQASVILDEEGQPTKMVGSHIDVTSLKKLETELQQAQKMEAIGTLAGGIAHDFNNILSAVLGYTELALGAVGTETPIRDDLQEVLTAGLRAKDLVSQILTFARKSGDELKPIQVDLIIKEVLKFIRSSLPTTIEIKQNIESSSFIMGNPTQVHQLMMNLCTNAAHAMEEKGGILEVTLKDITIDSTTNQKRLNLKPGDYFELKVSDTGTGIESHIIEKIFEPYFTTKNPGVGTGMGLAMVHSIVETYGGNIFVESQLGKGTVFTMYIPITEKMTSHQTYKLKELPTGQERILFVDDEDTITKIASRMLGQLGYTVTTQTDSVAALELFRSRPSDFDLVISDVTMPKMTGDQLTAELIKMRPDIAVILCTGYSKRLSKEDALKMGIKAFVYKPIVKEDLAKTVRDVLDMAKD